MRVLIVSRTPWNCSGSFGNTFENLFSGIPDLEIYNICCQSGNMDSDIVMAAFQMTEKSVMKCRLRRGASAGSMIYAVKPTASADFSDKSKISGDVGVTGKMIQSLRGKRPMIAFFARDLIWKMGRWKDTKALDDFLKMADPDVLYFPLYRSMYMCDIQKYIIRRLNRPVTGHISDDIYSMPEGFAVSPLYRLYQSMVRKKISAVIAKCAYLEVFAENMQEEYQRIFHKKCYLIGKGVRKEVVESAVGRSAAQKNDGLNIKGIGDGNAQGKHFLYAGNLGAGRYKVLAQIGVALDDIGSGNILDIYSASDLSTEMNRALQGSRSICFHGAVPAKELETIRLKSDYLVHVENFDKKSIYETRMSFSTKIIDYLLSGKPVLAVGPEEVNSIRVLKSRHLAAVVSDPAELPGMLEALINGRVDEQALTDNGYRYLAEERNIVIIQTGMLKRLKRLAGQK